MLNADSRDVIVRVGNCVLGRWLFYLVHAACDAAAVPFAIGEDDQLLPALGEAGGPRVLITVALTRRHIELIESGRASLIAVVDDPVDSVRFTKADMGFDTLGAIREQARIASTNSLLYANPRTTVISRGTLMGARDIVALVVSKLKVSLPPLNAQGLVDTFGGAPDEPWTLEHSLQQRSTYYVPLDRLAELIPTEDALTTRQIVSPLVLGAVSHEAATVTWDAKLFYFGQRSIELSISRAMGITRPLFHGPDLYLLRGSWRCRIIITFSPAGVGEQFTLGVFSSRDLMTKVIFHPTEEGKFEGQFGLENLFPERGINLYFNGPLTSYGAQVKLHNVSFLRGGRDVVRAAMPVGER